MNAHYALSGYGLDTGALGTPDSILSLRTTQQGFSSAGQPVVVGAGGGISTPYGGANIQGRVSAGMLAALLIGVAVFYVRTKGIQL